MKLEPVLRGNLTWSRWGSFMGVEAERLRAVGIDPLLPAVPARSADAELADLYRDHAPRLIRVAAAITLNLSLAEDVTHDAFVGLQRRFETVDRPAAYLQRSVVNLSLKVLRRRKIAERLLGPQLLMYTWSPRSKRRGTPWYGYRLGNGSWSCCGTGTTSAKPRLSTSSAGRPEPSSRRCTGR